MLKPQEGPRERGDSMRARVIVTQAPGEVLDAGVRFTRDVLVPAARQQEGYRGYVALYDHSTGHAMAVTLWENEHAETDSDEAARAGREEAAKAFGATIVSVDKYDVAFAEVT